MNKPLSNNDAHYEPFPAFVEWLDILVNTAQWDAVKQTRQKLVESMSVSLQASTDTITRMAAYDTGALEKLYETDRGITYNFARYVEQTNPVEPHQEDALRFAQSQLDAYELTIDAVTKKTPISEAWLREIHATICSSQDTYTVITQAGKQDIELPKGEYKKSPNHVTLKDGSTFAFAPVHETEYEVRRLIEELRSDAFETAHPVLQAAYSHYALVRIHPFADGNGRVCRVLASLYLYRACSIPLLIYADQRQDYLDVLNAADRGDYKAFVDYIFERCIETIEFQIEFIKTPHASSIDDNLTKIQEIIDLTTHTPAELDKLGNNLAQLAVNNLNTLIKKRRWVNGVRVSASIIKLTIKSNYQSQNRYVRQHYRTIPASGRNAIHVLEIVMESKLGDQTKLKSLYSIFIEKDNLNNPSVILGQPNNDFITNASDIKTEKQAYKLRLQMWAERELATLVDRFQKSFSDKYEKK